MKAIKLMKWLSVVTAVMLLTVLGMRAWDSQRGPPLELWHTFVPHEMTAGEIAASDWTRYLAAEARVFEEVRTQVTEKLGEESRHAANRYNAESPIYPGRFAVDWNRSFIMEPDGAPVGAVVLLHGLTDSPYSARHIAQRYRDNGYVAVAIRLPGHGTVPSGLTDVEWDQWSEATRLAVREVRRRAGASVPLHVVGYSNGGALALKYALVPEFNPFKYNSFPVNAARQSSLVARALQQQLAQYARDGRLAELAPILTFQSVVDFTVSTRAIVNALYVNLPANGSELVLFDLNRSVRFGPLFRAGTDTIVTRLLPDPPRTFRTAIITNAGPGSADVVERVTEAGATTQQTRPLGLAFPRDVFSLSHIALPFPLNDALYGLEPDPAEDFGVNLGAMATRGERGALVISVDALNRLTANPFFSYLLDRIEEGIGRTPAH
ncbi:MAG: alpha/beta fold hydrolase [Proteobacteria bacterium]|nr:alpha/beta fold hydrolase [Pseudomonadota bacterium]